MAITQIKGSNIADGTVVAADVADDAVTTVKILNANVTTGKLADNAVTGAKMAMGSDARGDTLYYNGTDYARLAKGTNGQVLKMGVNDPAWGADSVDLTADQSWTGSQRATLAVPTWSAPNLTFDLNAGQNFSYTTVANTTINFSNIPNGQSGYIIFTNGGNHTVALAATSKADIVLPVTISTSGKYILSYISDGTNAYLTNSAIIA